MRPFFANNTTDTSARRGTGGAVKGWLTRPVAVSRRAVFAWCAALVLTGIALLLGGVRAGLTRLPMGDIAQSWGGDGTRYSRCAVYFSPEKALTADGLTELRTGLEQALTQASFEANPDARLWADVAGFECTAAAASSNNTATVTVTGIAGDIALFADQQPVTGSWMRWDDAQKDTAVLDELTAWLLFGSTDVTGQTVQLDGTVYTVCGVVALPTDAAARLTYGQNPRVWVWAEALAPAEEIGYTFYQALLPRPTAGYGEKLLQDTLGSQVTPVNISDRFTVATLWKTLKALPRAALRSEAVSYPWFENAALYRQAQAALVLGGQLICFLYPALWTVCRLGRAWRRRPIKQKDLAAWLEARRQQKLQRDWEAGQENHPEL